MKHPFGLRRAFLALPLALALLAFAPIANAQDETNARDKKAFFDVNQTPQSLKELRGRRSALPPAAAALKGSLGIEGVVSLDPLTGTARA